METAACMLTRGRRVTWILWRSCWSRTVAAGVKADGIGPQDCLRDRMRRNRWHGVIVACWCGRRSGWTWIGARWWQTTCETWLSWRWRAGKVADCFGYYVRDQAGGRHGVFFEGFVVTRGWLSTAHTVGTEVYKCLPNAASICHHCCWSTFHTVVDS